MLIIPYSGPEYNSFLPRSGKNAKTSAPREVRRRLRQQMYYLNKHWEHEWRELDEHSLNVLLGQANFIWDMDRDNPEFTEYRRQLLEIRRYFRN